MVPHVLLATAFAADPASPVLVQGWATEADQNLAFLGQALSAGDFDGDGFADVVVAAISYSTEDFINEGLVSVFGGSPSGPSDLADWSVHPTDQENAIFGRSVSAGDVNGDGFHDLLVGANTFDDGETDEGGAFLYLGSSVGLELEAAWTAESDSADAEFGYAASAAGDVNGDGFDDVVIGAPRFDSGNPTTAEGRAYLFLGSAVGPATTPSLLLEGDPAEGAWFGFSVSSAGDVDADGFGDVLVGAWQPSTLDAGTGAVLLYGGDAGGLSSSPTWSVESDAMDASLGTWVSSAGDVNADGFGDVIIGGTPFDPEVTDAGVAFAYLGEASGLAVDPVWTIAGRGSAVAGAGDVNADGFDDVILGAPLFADDPDELFEGAASLWLGMSSGIESAPAWVVQSNLEGAHVGEVVASAGDVNGDGFGDVIVGAPRAASLTNPASDNGGSATLYLGAVNCLGDQDCEAVTVTGGFVLATDDGDTIAERGEQVEIVWQVENDSTVNAVGVVSTTSLTDQSASIVADVGVPAGGADVASHSSDDVVGTVLAVADDCVTDHNAELVVVLSSGLGSQTFAFELPIVCDLPLVLATEPWVVGSPTTSTVTGALPFENVHFVVSVGGPGAGPCPPTLGGLCLDVTKPFPKVQRVTADADGTATWTMTVPATVPVGSAMWIQALVGRGAKSNVEARITE